MADRIDQNGGVETEPIRHLNNYNSAEPHGRASLIRDGWPRFTSD